MKTNVFKKGILILALGVFFISCEKNNGLPPESPSATMPKDVVVTTQRTSNANTCITLNKTEYVVFSPGANYLRLTTTNISGSNATYPRARNFKFLNLPAGLEISTFGGSLGTFQKAGETKDGLVRLRIKGNIPSGFVLQFSFDTYRYRNCSNSTVFGSVALN